jgi:hypothetical protein
MKYGYNYAELCWGLFLLENSPIIRALPLTMIKWEG